MVLSTNRIRITWQLVRNTNGRGVAAELLGQKFWRRSSRMCFKSLWESVRTTEFSKDAQILCLPYQWYSTQHGAWCTGEFQQMLVSLTNRLLHAQLPVAIWRGRGTRTLSIVSVLVTWNQQQWESSAWAWSHRATGQLRDLQAMFLMMQMRRQGPHKWTELWGSRVSPGPGCPGVLASRALGFTDCTAPLC